MVDNYIQNNSMKEQKDLEKDLEKKPTEENPNQQDMPEQQAATTVPVDDMGDDDNVATAEEMEAFIRDRREKEREKKEKKDDDKTDVFGEFVAPENSIDPYLDPDPTLPWVKYDESIFLSRGCRKCPRSYVPVSNIETHSCSKVTSTNWMSDIRQPGCTPFDCVEVRFKNNRKDFYRLPDGLEVTEGDMVAVEGMPGHDIGIVSLTGEVCRIQMKKHHVDPKGENVKKLFRRAKSTDIERWTESLKSEHNTLLKTRQITQRMNLEMKVNDVEYQGDNSKAIFYYTADDRVDFRTADQGAGRGVPCAHRDEADRCAPRGRQGGRFGHLWPRALLQHMADQFQVGDHQRGQDSADTAQPAETGRTVRQAEMLPEL